MIILSQGKNSFTRNIAAAGDDPVKKKQPLTAATQVAFKNYAPFKDCRTEINDTFVDYVDFINIAMPLCTIWSSTVTAILITQEVYKVLKEMR